MQEENEFVLSSMNELCWIKAIRLDRYGWLARTAVGPGSLFVWKDPETHWWYGVVISYGNIKHEYSTIQATNLLDAVKKIRDASGCPATKHIFRTEAPSQKI